MRCCNFLEFFSLLEGIELECHGYSFQSTLLSFLYVDLFVKISRNENLNFCQQLAETVLLSTWVLLFLLLLLFWQHQHQCSLDVVKFVTLHVSIFNELYGPFPNSSRLFVKYIVICDAVFGLSNCLYEYIQFEFEKTYSLSDHMSHIFGLQSMVTVEV